MNIVLLGAPGSGKRTQAKKLMGKYAIPEVCTGEILRMAVSDGAPLGRDAKAYMDKGELVPDSIVLGLVHERLRKGDCGMGYIIDGFPRNESQAVGLEKMLAAIGAPVTTTMSIEVETEELMRRMLGRRICSMCGQVYNIYFLPPTIEGACDICGGDFFRRDDDQVETARKRLAIYESQKVGLAEYYEQKGIFKTISGTGSPDAIFRRICDALEKK